MNRSQAIEMQTAIAAIGGFTSVEVEHHGFISVVTPEIENDGRWCLYLWAVNAQSGNRNCEMITEYTADAKTIGRVARVAKGKATKRDRDAMARIAAEKAND